MRILNIYGNEIEALKYFIEQNNNKEHPDHIMNIILERITHTQNHPVPV